MFGAKTRKQKERGITEYVSRSKVENAETERTRILRAGRRGSRTNVEYVSRSKIRKHNELGIRGQSEREVFGRGEETSKGGMVRTRKGVRKVTGNAKGSHKKWNEVNDDTED